MKEAKGSPKGISSLSDSQRERERERERESSEVISIKFSYYLHE